MLSITQPVMYKLQDVSLRILPPEDIDLIGNVPIALLDMCHATGVDPEHPRPRRLLLDPVTVLDGELRLASRQSAIRIDRSIHAYPTPSRPKSAAREPGTAYF